MSISYLIYYVGPNPEYNKTYTIDDVSQDNEELYEHLLGDWMTLGRVIPSYEEWNPKFIEGSLKTLIKGTECALQIDKIVIDNNLDDRLMEFDPKVNRFIEPKIQARFLELHENKNEQGYK